MKEKIEIAIIDDHKMIRQGLKQLLEIDGDIKVIDQAGDGESCMSIIEYKSPEIILLDINMPNKSGLQILKEIKAKYPNQKILMLTIHNEVDYLVKAMELGANGYILKESECSVLKKAIWTIHEGDMFIEPSLTNDMRERVKKQRGLSEEEILTKREIEVLKLIAEGLFNKEIASRLSISEKTVKNHVSSIFKKLKVADRTQAAVYAIKNNFVSMI